MGRLHSLCIKLLVSVQKNLFKVVFTLANRFRGEFIPLNSPLVDTSVKRSHRLSVGFFHERPQPLLDRNKAEAVAADGNANYIVLASFFMMH